MQRRENRKVMREVRRSCASSGIETIEVSAHGKGNHQGVVFSDTENGARVKLIFSGAREISPGVQRRILKRLEEITNGSQPNSNLADRLREIFERIFK
jgi:hypothetical protein